jgi:hypothetical protein
MLSERFTPGDLSSVLSFPFRMIVLDRALYSENFAPDLRFAALLATAVALPLVAGRRNAPPQGALRGDEWRVLAFFATSLMLWLASSANGRYGLIVLLISGIALARITERLLPTGVARVALAVLLVVQFGTSVVASPPRWFIAEPWSWRWLPYDVPERALREPALYITVEVLPMAVLAPFVHPASSFVNFRGQYSIPSGSPKLAALLERHRDRVRTLGRGLELVDGKPREEQLRAYDATLLRIGYRVDADDCFTISWQRDDTDPLSRAANWLAGSQLPHEPLSVVSCALRTAMRKPADDEMERHVSALFDRMEKACPRLFRRQTAVTEPLGSGWSRNYPGLDARLEASAERVILHRYRAGIYFDLGRLSDWEREEAVLPSFCR